MRPALSSGVSAAQIMAGGRDGPSAERNAAHKGIIYVWRIFYIDPPWLAIALNTCRTQFTANFNQRVCNRSLPENCDNIIDRKALCDSRKIKLQTAGLVDLIAGF